MPLNEEVLKQAIEHHQAGKLEAAERLYHQLLTEEANHPGILQLLGVAANQRGRFAAAVDYLKQSIAGDANSVGAHNNLGEAYRSLGQFDAAIAAYQKAIDIDPNFFEAHNNMGIALQGAGKDVEALDAYERAIQINPMFPIPYVNIATILHRLGERESAKKILRQALLLQPDLAEAHLNLGMVFADEGDAEGALRHFQQAVQINPKLANAHLSLGNIHFAAGRLDAAADSFRRALSIAPNLANAHNNLGIVRRKQQRLMEAIQHFRQALAIQPKHVEAQLNMGGVLQQQNKLADAEVCYRRALELRPGLASALNNLGAISREKGNDAEAMKRYEEAIAADPDYAEAHFNVGAIHREKGRLTEARAAFEKTLACDPDNVDAIVGVARVDQAEGNFEAARTLYLKAIERKPNMPDAHHNLGVIYQRIGDLDEAAKSLQNAVSLAPTWSEARVNLGMVLWEQGDIAAAREQFTRISRTDPNNMIAKLRSELLCPIVPDSQAEIDEFRSRLQTFLDDAAKRSYSIKPVNLQNFGVECLNIIAAQGRNDLPIKRRLAETVANWLGAQPAPAKNDGAPHIGFVVTDNHEDAFIRCFVPVLNAFRQGKMKLTVACSSGGKTKIAAALANSEVGFLTIAPSLSQAIETLRQARFDVLYHWEAATDSTNYSLPFFRTAPVQCTSWGLQVTSGIVAMDQFLSCELAEPANAAEHYSEKLILMKELPISFTPLALKPSGKSAAEFGFSEARHKYVCTQQVYKFHPDFDELIGALLRRDPNGVFAFRLPRSRHVAQQITDRLRRHRPDFFDRILPLPWLSGEDYLRLIEVADVILDSVRHGGWISAWDALTLNKPIVTLAGEFGRERTLAAVYRKMGIDDCIAADKNAYVDIALRLAADPAHRQNISERINSARDRVLAPQPIAAELETVFEKLIAAAR